MLLEPVGVDVGFEMMNSVERFVPEDGESTGSKCANEERTKQARGIGDGDIVNIIFSEMSVVEGFVNDGEDSFKMGTSGNFGNNATIGGEDVDLGDDDVAENLRRGGYIRGGVWTLSIVKVADNSCSGFVTGSFDGKDFHGVIIAFSGEKS